MPSQVIGNGGGIGGVVISSLFNAETLTYTDDTNYVAGPLSYVPKAIAEVNVFVIDGVTQDYGVDYTVRSVSGGTAPGYYVCVAIASTAPGGGAFVGGANPSAGIETILASGDKLRVIYPSS